MSKVLNWRFPFCNEIGTKFDRNDNDTNKGKCNGNDGKKYEMCLMTKMLKNGGTRIIAIRLVDILDIHPCTHTHKQTRKKRQLRAIRFNSIRHLFVGQRLIDDIYVASDGSIIPNMSRLLQLFSEIQWDQLENNIDFSTEIFILLGLRLWQSSKVDRIKVHVTVTGVQTISDYKYNYTCPIGRRKNEKPYNLWQTPFSNWNYI